MVKESAKTLAWVITAIKDLRELKGSSSRDILRYISSTYNVPNDVARSQVETALKRGVAYGILKKNGGHYVLPLNSGLKCEEIASQEIGLMDFCRKMRSHSKRRGCKSKRRRSSRRSCKCKPKRSRRSRSRRRRGCRKKSRRRRSRRRMGCKKKSRRRRSRRKMSCKRRSRRRRSRRKMSCKRRSSRKRKCKCGGLGNRRDRNRIRRGRTASPSEKFLDSIRLDSMADVNDLPTESSNGSVVSSIEG